MPAPVPDIDDAPFWAAASERRLVFQRCGSCGKHRHPPSPMCPACQSTQCEWAGAPTRGVLFSYTVTHVAPHPELRGRVPYVVALVCFPGLDNLRLITNIVNAQPGQLRIGDEVELLWEPVGEGMSVPRFALPGEAAAERAG
jgi:hypothetical protein